METETNIKIIGSAAADFARIEDHEADTWLTLTMSELATVVQLAYDEFGIVAQPSLQAEAERGEQLPDVLGAIHDHVAAAHAQQAENRSGVRALGFASVHGVDL